MRCLFDTHAFLWAATNDSHLSTIARDIIEDVDNTALVSTSSLWEIAIKLSIGKLRLDVTFLDMAVRTPAHFGIEHLDIVSRLPLHHRDPFDRLLVAQCLADGLPLVSGDTALDPYGIERIW